MALVDRRGLAGLSMRALAAAVGSGPMSIYNHITDRAELEVLVVEAVVQRVDWRGAPGPDWRADVRRIALAMWRALRAHPHVVPLVLTRRSRSPALLEVCEALLGALAGSGRRGDALLVAFRAVQALIMGFVQVELAGPLSRAAGERPQAVIARFRRLPAARYPRLIEVATAALTSDAEDEVARALDALLDGLDAPATS